MPIILTPSCHRMQIYPHLELPWVLGYRKDGTQFWLIYFFQNLVCMLFSKFVKFTIGSVRLL